MIKEKYKELGGWLLFYYIMCFVSIGLSLLGLLGITGSWISTMSIGIADTGIIALILVVSLVSIIGTVVTLSLIISAINKRKHSATIREMIVFQAVIRIICSSVILVAGYILLGSLDDFIGEFIRDVISIGGYTAIWYTYFDKSVRVGVYTGEISTDMPNQYEEPFYG